MAWFRICLSEDEQQVVRELRESHPDAYVRRRMWTLWLLHCGVTREQTALYVGVDRSTVERFVVLTRLISSLALFYVACGRSRGFLCVPHRGGRGSTCLGHGMP